MKILLLFLLFSCSKTSYQEIPVQASPQTSFNALSIESQNYSQDIDLLVAFLWPSKIETDSERHELQLIISVSRDLKQAKEKFQEKSFDLKLGYNKFDCACVLEFRCSGEETHTDEAVCLEIEEAIFENHKRLPEIYALVDVIKEKISSINGEWLQTNFDFPEMQTSTFNFKTLELDLKVFGTVNDLPISYLFTKPEIFEDKDFQQLTYSSPRKQSSGEWKIEVTPYQTKASLLFQGELFWNHSGIKRRGFILWEHARK